MNAKQVNVFGAPVVSVIVVLAFVAMGIIAYFVGDTQLRHDLLLMYGSAAILMARTVVDYYCGSSSGSREKDEVIAASNPPPAVVPVNQVPT